MHRIMKILCLVLSILASYSPTRVDIQQRNGKKIKSTVVCDNEIEINLSVNPTRVSRQDTSERDNSSPQQEFTGIRFFMQTGESCGLANDLLNFFNIFTESSEPTNENPKNHEEDVRERNTSENETNQTELPKDADNVASSFAENQETKQSGNDARFPTQGEGMADDDQQNTRF